MSDMSEQTFDNNRSCGCHTIYLLKRGSGIDTQSLFKARVTPGAILPVDNDGDLTPMIFHTCGAPQHRHLVIKDGELSEKTA
jgi:hypothetical protein